jgi:serine/threonine protein kinase
MIEVNDIKNIRRDKVFINGNFDFSKLNNITKINCGAFGCVYKINNVSKHICIKLSKISNKNFSNIFKENDLGKKLVNFIPNIYETGVSIINKTKYYYTIMDFIDGDEINNYEFNNQQIIELFIFLIKFMYILHKNNLAYTDIKPQNIMYDGKYFKVVDIDTIKHQYIYKNLESEIFTSLYYFNKINFVRTIHQLQQLSSCVLTCLELMGMYPNCNKKNYDTRKKNYVNAMIKFVKDNNIKSPIELEDRTRFYKLLMKLNEKTNNLTYSLLFLINIYIELIPKFTTSYINVNFVVNELTYYLPYLSTRQLNGNELCYSHPMTHDIILSTDVKYELLENIKELVDMIPASINVDHYIKNIYPQYKKIITEKKNNTIYKIYLQDKIKYHIIDDEYEYYRYDPKTLEHLKIFI